MDVVMRLTHRLLSDSQTTPPPLDEPVSLFCFAQHRKGDRIVRPCRGGYWSLPLQPETRKGHEAWQQRMPKEAGSGDILVCRHPFFKFARFASMLITNVT